MESTTIILKNILLPFLKEDSFFREEKATTSFYGNFETQLLKFEEDAKPLYASIYSLELEDPESIISKLPEIYNVFIKAVAENYVLGQSSASSDYLITSGNKTFAEETAFLQTLQKAITKVERKRVKADLPDSYNRLTFELDEKDLEIAAKKKGREDLKAKMKAWDKQLAEVPMEVEVIAMAPVSNKMSGSKVISLAWAKYAVAACTVIAVGTWVYLDNFKVDEPKNDIVVTPDVKKETENDTLMNNKKTLHPQILDKNIEDNKEAVVNNDDKVKSITNDGSAIGYSDTKDKESFRIIYNDNSSLISSLEKNLKKNPNQKDQEEYDRLLKYKNKYTFDGKTIIVYKKTLNKAEYVLTSSSGLRYYFDGANYYKIEKTEIPLDLIVVKDPAVKEELERILFDNE